MAVTIAATVLAAAVRVDQVTAARLLPVAAELVDRFAPDAPEAVSNEAAIRCAGWLAEAPSSGVRSESLGDVRTSWTPAMTGALRHSGAMALLSPWKVRRAGAV